jgi:pimeloyl-ACP methyl ester carboxylesterase
MAPVAIELARTRGVLEPVQTALSVDGQIDELRVAIEQQAAPPVALVGYSWGAWLSLLVTAQYPALVRKLVLVSSGPFEERYAAEILPTRVRRLNSADANEARSLLDTLSKGEGASLARLGELLSKADTLDPLPADGPAIEADDEIYRRVWPEAAELRRSGRLLELAAIVRCPVVAIHGDYDPHPAEGVREPLSRIVQDFRFVLLPECGHTPWRERRARDRFFDEVRLALG